MKLFVGAYEAAGTFPVAMYLYTEEDMRIEANRAKHLKRTGAERLLWYINACELYGKFEGVGHIFICVSLDYKGQRRQMYNNLNDKTADKYLKGEKL